MLLLEWMAVKAKLASNAQAFVFVDFSTWTLFKEGRKTHPIKCYSHPHASWECDNTTDHDYKPNNGNFTSQSLPSSATYQADLEPRPAVWRSSGDVHG